MTDYEAADLMDLMKLLYPVYAKKTDAERMAMADIWAAIFIDDDFRIVKAALEAFYATDEKGFPPVPGQIRAKINMILSEGEMTEAEAWGRIADAIRNSAYNSQEEFNKLPPILQKLVRRPSQLREWGNMPSETVHSVVASNVQRAYRTVAERERVYRSLSPDVKELVTQIAAAQAMPDLPEQEPKPLPSHKATKMPEYVRELLLSPKRVAQSTTEPPILPSAPRRTRAEIIEILKSGNS